MLYKLTKNLGKFDGVEPIPFKDFSSFDHLEKDLENLIARNILHVLFEDKGLMPILQERPLQKEADIYALNERGELIIFELKRRTAGDDAVLQALQYAQHAGQWTYAQLQEMYRKYSGDDTDLVSAHQEAFALDVTLDPKEINNRQHLIVIGSAADEALINSVEYWRKQGISIDFLPYRVYELAGAQYFEFFALPYDRHTNPSQVKGVLFDTNRSYDEDAIWYMMEKARVAAFGDAKRFINYLNPGDFVFFSHVRKGLVAAGKVCRGPVRTPDKDTHYRKVDFITPVPIRSDHYAAMPFRMVSEITGKTFYWAKTIKVPYLSVSESQQLAQELLHYLQTNSS